MTKHELCVFVCVIVQHSPFDVKKGISMKNAPAAPTTSPNMENEK